MRFPVDPLPPVRVTEDPYEIQETAAVRPLRPVSTPLAQQRLLPRRRAPATPVRETPQPSPPPVERRAGGDRRKADRRVANVPVLIDTRSGQDRRRNKRRADDPTFGIDEKA